MTPSHPPRRQPRFRAPLSLALTLVLTALGAAQGCSNASSPTLPIPPPSALSTAPDAEGYVLIQGSNAIEGAMVSAYNERIAEGVIGEADDMGNFQLRLRGGVGDPIAVWQTVGADRGEIVTVLVPSP